MATPGRTRGRAMTRRLRRGAMLVAVAALAAASATAQSSGAWQSCRKEPVRACVIAEALARARDDAPPVRNLQFAEWERLLYLRLSEIAAATKDRDMFDEAKRSAQSNPTAEARRSALRWVAAAQARGGFPDEASKTLDLGDTGGFATEEIAIALARAGRTEETDQAVRRLDSTELQIRALVRIAQATGEPQWLDRARALVRDLEDGYTQSALLPLLAVTSAGFGQVDQAMRLARSIAVSYHRAQALAGIAALTRNPVLLAEARRFATGFDGRGHEDEIWAGLARAEIALGILEGARATLEAHLPKSPTRALAAAVGELAAAYWLAGDSRLAAQLVDALLGGSWAIGEARAVLARRLIERGRFEEANRVSFLADEITFDNLTAEIALKQASVGALRDALETADRIQQPARRSPTLAEIASMMR